MKSVCIHSSLRQGDPPAPTVFSRREKNRSTCAFFFQSYYSTTTFYMCYPDKFTTNTLLKLQYVSWVDLYPWLFAEILHFLCLMGVVNGDLMVAVKVRLVAREQRLQVPRIWLHCQSLIYFYYALSYSCDFCCCESSLVLNRLLLLLILFQ